MQNRRKPGRLANYVSIPKRLCGDTIQGYTAVTSVQSQQSIKNLESDYVLLPLWLVTYRQKNSDKLFYYAMNGQQVTAGILPVDKMKVALVALLTFSSLYLYLA